MKVKKATLKLGELELDCYGIVDVLSAEGEPEMGFSATQCGMILGLTKDPRQAAKRIIQKAESKEFQTRFPHGFVNHQNCVISEGESKGIKVNIITLETFSRLLRVCDTPEADLIGDALTSVSLRKLVSMALGLEFSDQKFLDFVAARLAGIEKRNAWTDAIHQWLELNAVPKDEHLFVYSSVSDHLNLRLTGHKARYWVEKLNVTRNTLRDQWNSRLLSKIDAIENAAAVQLERNPNSNPLEIIERCIDFLGGTVDPHPLKTEEPFDRVAYMREYMRQRRAKERND